MTAHGGVVKYEFRLRFPEAEVMFWAGRYAYADDAEVEAIGRGAEERGWFSRDEFLTVAHWKTPRSRSRCERNDETSVESLTRLALSTDDERARIETLTRLHGVGYPTASVLLHLAHRNQYPIIDFRALWSLGVEEPPAAYSFDFWWAYTLACRSLATTGGVRMRTLDRALWQFSKEEQPARLSSSAGPASAPRRTPKARRGLKPGQEATMDEDFNTAAYTRLVAAAIEGRLIAYSEVAPRRVVGTYLYRIADYEKAHRRPPLTGIVVHKQDGRPGEGFRIAMEQIGYAKPDESDEDMWARACADVFAYWRP
jgi:hypothetical protein